MEKGKISALQLAIKGAIVPSGWFTEFFLLTIILPFLADWKKGMKYGMMTVFAVMMTLVLVNLIVLFVLGSTTDSSIYPLMLISRYISIAEFFEHLESVVMAIWIVGAFVKISVFYYVVALGTAQWLNLSSYRSVIWPLGIIIVEFSFWSLPNTMELARYNVGVVPFIGLFIQMINLVFRSLIRQDGSKEEIVVRY